MKPLNFFTFFAIALVLSTSAIAWMPETHVLIQKTSASQSYATPIGQLINKYPQDFYACQMLSDISVFYYFSEGFNSIGKEYKATHSPSLCARMVTNAVSERDKVCAYGVCAHQVEDSISHNQMVPAEIALTGLPNGIIHIFAEEKVNDDIVTSQLRNDVTSSLTNAAGAHKEQFRSALIAGGDTLPFDNMYDKFTDTVIGSAKYSPGFQGFLAVPTSVHMSLVALFILNLLVLWFLVKNSYWNTLGKIMMGINVFFVVLIFGLYVLFFTNQLWSAAQTVSTPVGWFVPVPNEQTYLANSVKETNNLISGGMPYINRIVDPTGSANLFAADAAGAGVRNVIFGLIVIFIGVFGYLVFISKGKSRGRR
jgi:hypothetical protein